MDISRLNNIGHWLIKAGLWIILLWIGIFKFTPTEAQAILPFIENSPFFAWQLNFMSIQGISNSIGTLEIITALLMIIGIKNKTLGNIGYGLGALTFMVTLTFLFTTPGMFKTVDGIFVANGFLLKDIILMGACLSQLKGKIF